MNTTFTSKARKIALLTLIAMSIFMSACTKTLGGHSVTVNMPKNDCGVVACSTESQTEIISIR